MRHISKSSLVKRVLGILVLLVLIPLSIDALLLAQRDRKIKRTAALSQLELMGRAFEIVLGDFIAESTLLLKEGIAQRTFDEKIIPPSQLKRIEQTGRALFIGLNPNTGVDELFFIQKQEGKFRGLSVSEEHFLKRMEPLAPFSFELINKEVQSQDLLTVVLPVEGSNFSLKVSISKQAASALEGANVYHHLLLLLGLILCVGGMGTVWLVYRMARPLKQLTAIMEAVGSGDTSPRYAADPFGFEINTLGACFNHTLDALLCHMEEVKVERVKRERLAEQLEIGQAIQFELLPKELPSFPGFSIAGRFVPAREVSGDFYDLFPHADRGLFIVMADGADKGISACLYSLIVRSMLRSHIASGEPLADIVRLTNNLFCRDTKESGNFVTAWMGLLDTQTGELKYTSAGHLPAVLMHPDGATEELTTAGMALGAERTNRVEVKSTQLPPGGRLVLYTDGVIDAQNKKGEPFGRDRLFTVLRTSQLSEPESIVAAILGEIERFTSSSEPYDDLTVLAIKRLRATAST